MPGDDVRRSHGKEAFPGPDSKAVRETRGRRHRRGGGTRLPLSRPRRGAAEDAENPAVEPLRAGLRQVVRRRVHEGVGRQERNQRRRRPHLDRRDQRPGRRGGGGQEGPRPLHVPGSTRGLREAGHRPPRDLRGGREEARQDDLAGGEVDAQPQDQEVLRLFRLVRSRPGQLPQGPLGKGRVSERPRHLGRPGEGREEDQRRVRQPGRSRALAGARQQHGDAGRPVVVRRIRPGRRGQRLPLFEGDDRGDQVRPVPLQGRR